MYPFGLNQTTKNRLQVIQTFCRFVYNLREFDHFKQIFVLRCLKMDQLVKFHSAVFLFRLIIIFCPKLFEK